jgi:hypothetical protein
MRRALRINSSDSQALPDAHGRMCTRIECFCVNAQMQTERTKKNKEQEQKCALRTIYSADRLVELESHV